MTESRNDDFVPFFGDNCEVSEYDLDNDKSRFLPEQMFAINNSKCTFDINDYTVPIDKSVPNYEEIVKDAERIAAEIKQNPNSEFNKENLLECDNEELMFSAVPRNAENESNAADNWD